MEEHPLVKLIKYLLKDLINVNIKLDKRDFSQHTNNYTLVLKEGDKVLSVEDKAIAIDAEKLNEKQQNMLDKTLKELAQGGLATDSQIIDSEAYELEKEIQEEFQEGFKIVNYFKDKIPHTHLEILKAAAVIGKRYENGKPIDELKHQLSLRYGKLANNICNLYTSGYFETFFIPLYEEMSKRTSFKVCNFSNTFETLVNDFPFAEFINKRESLKETEERLRRRISSNRKYGIPHFKVLGIGKMNIDKISSITESLEKEGKVMIIEKSKTDKTIIVDLAIKK